MSQNETQKKAAAPKQNLHISVTSVYICLLQEQIMI